MKLKFLFLFLFFANFCVAQNQLRVAKTHYAFGDTIDNYYYLHENQEVEITFINGSSVETDIDGIVQEIQDSFLTIKNQKIFYSSIQKIAFNKDNHERKIRRIGKMIAYPELIFFGLTGISSALYNFDEAANQQNQYNRYFGFKLISLGGMIAYAPIALIGVAIASFTKTYFYVFKKDAASKRFCKMSVVHPLTK